MCVCVCVSEWERAGVRGGAEGSGRGLWQLSSLAPLQVRIEIKCVCVCVRERERERERDYHSHTHIQTHRYIYIYTHTQRERERERERERRAWRSISSVEKQEQEQKEEEKNARSFHKPWEMSVKPLLPNGFAYFFFFLLLLICAALFGFISLVVWAGKWVVSYFLYFSSFIILVKEESGWQKKLILVYFSSVSAESTPWTFRSSTNTIFTSAIAMAAALDALLLDFYLMFFSLYPWHLFCANSRHQHHSEAVEMERIAVRVTCPLLMNRQGRRQQHHHHHLHLQTMHTWCM